MGPLGSAVSFKSRKWYSEQSLSISGIMWSIASFFYSFPFGLWLQTPHCAVRTSRSLILRRLPLPWWHATFHAPTPSERTPGWPTAAITNATVNILIHLLLEDFFWNLYLWVGFLGQRAYAYLIKIKTVSQTGCTCSHSYTQWCTKPSPPHTPVNTWYPLPTLLICHSDDCKW